MEFICRTVHSLKGNCMFKGNIQGKFHTWYLEFVESWELSLSKIRVQNFNDRVIGSCPRKKPADSTHSYFLFCYSKLFWLFCCCWRSFARLAHWILSNYTVLPFVHSHRVSFYLHLVSIDIWLNSHRFSCLTLVSYPTFCKARFTSFIPTTLQNNVNNQVCLEDI